jgi:hypothetical protein
MSATQLTWFCLLVGGPLFVLGLTALIVLLILGRDGDQPALEPLPLVLPDEEPSGAHTVTAATVPRDRASVLVETGQLSTGELAALLADGGER